jgi:hypothetical protein
VTVGHHGNPVYRAVAWIPICVSVTWSPKFLTCGRFPWDASTLATIRLSCGLKFHHGCLFVTKETRNIIITMIIISSSSSSSIVNSNFLSVTPLRF